MNYTRNNQKLSAIALPLILSAIAWLLGFLNGVSGKMLPVTSFSEGSEMKGLFFFQTGKLPLCRNLRSSFITMKHQEIHQLNGGALIELVGLIHHCKNINLVFTKRNGDWKAGIRAGSCDSNASSFPGIVPKRIVGNLNQPGIYFTSWGVSEGASASVSASAGVRVSVRGQARPPPSHERHQNQSSNHPVQPKPS